MSTRPAEGMKFDSAKPRMALVLNGFSRALLEVGKVGTFGAEKYADNNWVHVDSGEERYTNALYRHLLAEGTGETLDSESRLRHAAHAAWCALARLDLQLRALDYKEPSNDK